MTKIPSVEERVEEFASLEHDRWSKWQKYMHSKIEPTEHDSLMQIGSEYIERWERQINTPYNELTETEKQSDRDQVYPYIEALTADRLALLTELRQVITKKLTTRTYKIITQYEPNSIASITIPANQESAYNLGATITLKDLQAHLDELINPTNV